MNRSQETRLKKLGAKLEQVRSARARRMARLDQLEKQANHLRMPIAYESMMYLLRHHIGVVRNRLAAGQP
jgi:hypothetical protein